MDFMFAVTHSDKLPKGKKKLESGFAGKRHYKTLAADINRKRFRLFYPVNKTSTSIKLRKSYSDLNFETN